MQNWEYAWEMIISLLESGLFFIFVEDQLNSRIIKNKTFTFYLKIIFIALDSLLIDYMNISGLSLIKIIILGIISYIIFTFIFYTNSFFKKILIPIIFTIVLLISENLVFLFLCLILQININELTLGGFQRIQSTLLYILMVSIFIFIIHFFSINNTSAIKTKKYIYLLYSFLGLFSCLYISALTIKSINTFHNTYFTNNLIFVSSFLSFLFILLLAYIYNLNREKEKNQKLLNERHQLMLEESEYKNLLELTASLRQFKHDVQHHIDAIKYISQHGTQDELEDYISNLGNSINRTHKFITSGNTAIDSILSYKIPMAESLGIKVSYALSIPNEFVINPITITTILGNLWNNAIEACEILLSTPNNSITPRIDFYIKPIQNMLLISIENSFNGSIRKSSDNKYLSTKNNPENHGLGLQRVIDMIKINDGFIDIDDQHNMFYVHIMFPINGEPHK